MSMTTNNENQKTIGALILHMKHTTDIVAFEGEEGRARAYLSVIKERVEDGYTYGPRPANIDAELTPEECLNEEELKYFNLTDEDIAGSNLPESIVQDMQKKRRKAKNKYTTTKSVNEQDNWFWKSLAQVLDLPEDEAIKVGRTMRNGKFVPLVYDIIRNRNDYEYEVVEEVVGVKFFS